MKVEKKTQKNIVMSPSKDLEGNEVLKLVGPRKAIDEVFKGNKVAAKFADIEIGHTRGCRKCNKERKEGNFCLKCGSQLTDKLEVEKIVGTHWIRIWKDGDTIWSDNDHPFNGGSSGKVCNMGLDYFQQIKKWYTIGWKW
jgi:hypothetical protein